MRTPLIVWAAMLSCARMVEAAEPASPPAPTWALAIHGGAGVINRGDLSPQKEVAYRAGLTAALAAGQVFARESLFEWPLPSLRRSVLS